MKRLLGLASAFVRKPPPVGVSPADVVHRENKWSLLRYRPRATGFASRTPILMIPSLINRHYVLDLTPGKSFVEWLVGMGHDVFVIDWGTPTEEDRYLSFDDICDGYIARALRVVCDHAGVARTHVLGYCLGGTLATIHAAARPERIASLTNLAAPVGFDDDGMLSAWMRIRNLDIEALAKATGLVPWPLMQAAFRLLKPTMPITKTVSLVDRAWDDEFLDGFLAVERWGHDNVSFPAECYRHYVQELYRGDALLRGTFRLGGTPVRLENIRCPLLAVTFADDHIVPWRSAAVVLNRAGSAAKRHIHLPGGHVGAVVSRRASTGLWPALADWWTEHDSASGEHPSAAPEPPALPRAC